MAEEEKKPVIPSLNTIFEDNKKKKCEAEGGKWINGACDYSTRDAVRSANEEVATRTPEQEVESTRIETRTGSTTAQEREVTGAYNKERGGYESSDGQFYPTDNPYFVPGSTGPVGSKIVFNEDNTVTVDGKVMSQEEYDTYKEYSGYREQQAQYAEQQKQQQSISEFGNIDPNLASLEQAEIDWSQAFTAGTVQNIPSILKSVGTGFVGGALTGNPAVAIGGAVVGAVAGIWGGVQGNIKAQQTGEIGASKDVLTNAKTNMMKLSRLAVTDPSKVEDYKDAYNFWLNEVYVARRQIKLETQGDLNAFMEDGRDILSDFDLFLEPDVGTAAIYKQRIIASLNSEVDPAVLVSQLLEDEEA